MRHYSLISTWPLQIYSSAIVFSPQTSIIRINNVDKVPTWFRRFPQTEQSWSSLIQTLVGHSGSVQAVAFSLDGKQIASGSGDKTIKLWDARTGHLQQTLAGHSGSVQAVAFSLDGKQIASGSGDQTIKLWDARTGHLQQTLVHDRKTSLENHVKAVALSSKDWQVTSKFNNQTIKPRKWEFAQNKFRRALPTRSEAAISIDESVSSDIQRLKLESLDTLQVSKQWICYKALPVFFLSFGLKEVCYAVHGDQIAVGFADGRVLCFEIDRVSLDSLFKIK